MDLTFFFGFDGRYNGGLIGIRGGVGDGAGGGYGVFVGGEDLGWG